MASCSTSFDSDTGWQTLLKELQKKATGHVNENNDEPILGVRVVYCNNSSSNPSNSDHSDLHNEHWKKALTDSLSDRPRSLEVGTVTGFDFKEGVVSVLWDCGNTRTYTYDLWKNLTVYSLGPAGYLGQMVFCDKCLDPSKGLAFRLARQNTSVGDLYDLCVQCYNEGDDEHMKNCFHCNIPSGNIDQDDDDAKKRSLPTREESVKYSLVGIFKHATVAHSDCNSATSTGEVLNIVHEEGKYDLRKANYYDSCAEVKLEDGSLDYWEAGSGGKVELKAIKPGEAPFLVAIDHYIKFGDVIVKEMFTYKTKLVKMVEPVLSYCFMRFSPPDDGMSCYSLTISGTRLTEITDTEIWRRCKDLKIVILLMNELNSLPEDLQDHASTVELVCVQHNKFTIVPPIIYEVLTNIKHLNLHGNQISIFPSELQYLQHLERLKFGRNYLYSLPDMFSGFKCLIEITFNNNFLTRLPPSFAELTRLESIDLTNNSFTCIPAPLLKLPNLKSIYMRFNRIHRLSPLEDIGGTDTLALLQNMVTLSLEGNPIYIRLKPSTDTTLENVIANFVTLEQFPGPITKALRVLVLGSCGSGKTSIVEAISFDKYVTPTTEMHHDHTVGIDRFSIPVKMTTEGEQDFIVELRLWDFAGERSYVMMNDLFITDGTLIWIAVNFETYEEDTPESFQRYVANWLQQVMTKNVRPIVWIIGTHTDKCTPTEVQKKAEHIRGMVEDECKLFRKELKNELETLKTIEETNKYGNRSPKCVRRNIEHLNRVNGNSVPCFVMYNLKVLHLTNTHTLSGFDNLKEKLACFLENKSFVHLKTKLNVNQQRAADVLRHEAEKLLSDGQAPILERSQVLDIIRNELGPQTTISENEHEASLFLEYLHQAGHLLDCKSNDVIMDVDWLIDLLKQVFHHNFSAMVAEKKRTSAFNQLSDDIIQRAIMIQKKTGTVEQQLLKALWPINSGVFKDLVKLLQTYGLAYETTGPSGYFFPWLVTESSPSTVPPSLTGFESRIMVSYEFSPCLPICFLQQLAVKCKDGVSIKKVYTNSFIVSESNQIQDELTTKTVFVSISHEKKCGQIKLYAITNKSQDTSLIKELWSMVMQIVKKMENLLCNWRFYSKFQRMVCCPLCTVPFVDLQIQTQVEPECPQALECYSCDKIIPPGYLVPPTECQIPADKYVDDPPDVLGSSSTSHSQQSVSPDRHINTSEENHRPVAETRCDSKSHIVGLTPPGKQAHYPQQQSQDDASSTLPDTPPPSDPSTAIGAEETTNQLEMGSDTNNTQQHQNLESFIPLIEQWFKELGLKGK